MLQAAVAARGTAHAMFATGNSQLAFVHALVHETEGVPWADTVVFHMDEYVGVGPDHPAGFQRWIRERIVEPAHPKAAYYVEGLGDAEAECRRYADLLRQHPLDLCCLGVGRERAPGLQRPAGGRLRRPAATSRWSSSSAACRAQQVNEGHFPGLDAVPTHAITVTIPALLRAGRVPGHRPRGAQGGAGRRRPDRPDHDRVPRLGAADDLPRHRPPRARLGPTAPRLRRPHRGGRQDARSPVTS